MCISAHMNRETDIIMIHYDRESYYYIVSEINKLIGETKEAGYSLVPLKIYLKNGYAKVVIGTWQKVKRNMINVKR